MNHAEEINKLIMLASQGSDFKAQGYRTFETEDQASLSNKLQSANLFFTCSVLGMKAVSHVIEDQAVNLGGQFRFYSAFQKFSRLKPQEERYRRILMLGNPVYVFGLPDSPLWRDPNLNVINLKEPTNPDQATLAQNWFVILDSPQLVSMALVARELPATNRPRGAPDKLIYRNFEGFWTYDREVILPVVALLDNYIQQQKSDQFALNK